RRPRWRPPESAAPSLPSNARGTLPREFGSSTAVVVVARRADVQACPMLGPQRGLPLLRTPRRDRRSGTELAACTARVRRQAPTVPRRLRAQEPGRLL